MLAAPLEHGVPLANRYAALVNLTIDMGRYAEPWEVSNYGEGSAGIVDLKNDGELYNTVFAEPIMHVQPQHVMDVAARLGIRSPLEPVPAVVLGTNDVTTLDMAGAYAPSPTVEFTTRPSWSRGSRAPMARALRARCCAGHGSFEGVADTVTRVLCQPSSVGPLRERTSTGRSRARPAPRSLRGSRGLPASRPISWPRSGSGSRASISRRYCRAPRSA